MPKVMLEIRVNLPRLISYTHQSVKEFRVTWLILIHPYIDEPVRWQFVTVQGMMHGRETML
jgi:hypothetical protein